jgi:hypothetical protein
LAKKHKLTILFLIIIIGFVIRLSFFMGNSFPLHDGGLFFVMIQDLISNHFSLPIFTSFNHANIPFIYPPLGFYIVGITEKLTGIDRLQLFRFFPLFISTLTIPAFFGLAVEVFKDEWKSLAATTFFSILPMGYSWIILGGGVTRAFGAFFGILALTYTIRFINNGEKSAAILGSMFCGLTVLSHPEWTWFLFYTIGLYVVCVFGAKKLKTIKRSLIIILGTAIIILPWVITIVMNHGKSLLLPLADDGFSRWNEIFRLVLLQWSGEKFIPIITIISIIGIISFIKKSEWFLVILLPVVFILQGRGSDQKAVIPLALLAGEGILSLIRYFSRDVPSINRSRKSLFIGFGIIIYLIIYILASTMISVSGFVKPMSEQYIHSIDWINKELPINSKVLVISGEEWIQDNYSEWVSALSGRESISLIQGYEWLPGFSDRIARYDQARYEYTRGTKYLLNWINENSMHPDYLILLNKDPVNNQNGEPDIPLLWQDALNTPGIKMVYQTESVLILDIGAALK